MTSLSLYPDRDSWLAARRRHVTATEAAGLLGVYATQAARERANPYALWMRKIQDLEDPPSRDMERRFAAGHQLEPLLHRWCEEDTGWKLVDPGDFAMFERGILSATPDRVREDFRALAEFKSEAVRAAATWHEGQKMDAATVQVNVGLHCADLGEAVLYVAFGLGLTTELYYVQRSDALVSLIMERVEEFWEAVQRGIPPSARFLDDSEAIGRSLAQIYKRETGATIVLDGSATADLGRYEELAEVMKKAKAEQQEIRNRVMHTMGAAARARVPLAGRAWKWETQERKEYTVPAGSTRVLRLVKDKEA